MGQTRYSESRTLVRGFRRLAGENREQFKAKILRLRRQFEQFNVDVSEVCQWTMSLRPEGKQGSDATKEFWEFFLEPERFLDESEKEQSDRYRRMVFDVAAHLAEESSLCESVLASTFLKSATDVRVLVLTQTATRLFARLGQMGSSHRQVLLKATAEWVVAHYLRSYQNWMRQREEWEKEKDEWQKQHPELNESVRDEFNAIFTKLNIRIKKPRVCGWERLNMRRDDCEWAGERIHVGRGKWKRHGGLCVNYKKFYDDYSKKGCDGRNFKNHFVENANDYLRLYKEKGGNKAIVMKEFLQNHQSARWFSKAWDAYMEALGINEKTVLEVGTGLPHCVRFGAEKDCQHNKHTNECESYRRFLKGRADLQRLEGLYREWRRDYLSGPAKPSFKYPSKRKLPMPKIFGEGFFRADFDNSVLELRMEGAGQVDFERFGFSAWPKDYEPQPQQTEITSVHINFLGTRARAGFHFRVRHKQSRFGLNQDEIDELRSRKYPSRRQDQKFLDEARVRLLKSFDGDAERELRILAVDLGTGGGGAALFKGRDFQKPCPLKVVKIEKLYESRPKLDKHKSDEEKKKEQKKGLGQQHVGRHLEEWAEGAAQIGEKRGQSSGPVTIRDHDMRRLSLHIRWMIRDWVRLNASQIIEEAERNGADLIVFESMRGFSAPGYDRLDEDKKRRLAFFAYGRIRRKVTEKAVERGMRVVTVPYFKSSQFCGECGREKKETDTKWGKKKRAREFHCESCGYKANSDANAAQVLAKVFWSEIKLPAK